MHQSIAKSVLKSDLKFTVGSGTTCPCVDDFCNGHPWDSIFNAQKNGAVDTTYKGTRRENAKKIMTINDHIYISTQKENVMKIMTTNDHMYISTQKENAMKMMFTNEYINTEAIKNGDHVNIPDYPTPDPSTNPLMSGPTNAESSADDANGPSAQSCVISTFLFYIVSIALN